MRYIRSLLIIISLFLCLTGFAQNGAGSYVSENAVIHINSNTIKDYFVENLYIGPNANITLDGEINVYSKRVWISPSAKISGSGRINIHSPSNNPFYEGWSASATEIDGNNGDHINVAVILHNGNGLRLTDISVPELSGNTPLNSASLKLGRALDLRVDGAHVYLNGHNLELGSEASILNANFRRHIVTDNSVRGHLIKEFTDIVRFVFPVGKAPGDYTPAEIRPSERNTKVNVSVTDYLASGLTFRDETIGMDRVWNIFPDKAQRMDYVLTHDKSTNGIAYLDAKVQIVQNADGGNWLGDVTQLISEGVHSRESIASFTQNTITGTWFTKFSLEAPQAVDDNVVMEFGENIVINVLENDRSGSSAILTNSVRIISNPSFGTAVVESNGSVTYTPNPGYVGDDLFEYEITDENGLTSKATVRITIMSRELDIPNAITPNGDGKNDVFVVGNRLYYDYIRLTVINRWGQEVYRDVDYKDTWDGLGLSEGTYFYIIEGIKGTNQRIFKGNVLIKRN